MSTKMDEDDWAHTLAVFRACLPRGADGRPRTPPSPQLESDSRPFGNPSIQVKADRALGTHFSFKGGLAIQFAIFRWYS
jgi:hypothetical protein